MKCHLVWTAALLFFIVVMCYLPLFIPSRTVLNKEWEAAFAETIHSDVYLATYISVFTITIVISFDMSIDFFFGLRKDGFIMSSVLLLGLWMFALVAMAVKEGSFLPLYRCAVIAREAVCAFAILTYLYEYGGPMWRGEIIVTLILLLTGASSSAAFAICRSINGPSHSIAYNAIPGAFIGSFIAIVIANVIKYYRELRQKGTVWESKEYCCVLYSCVLVIKTTSIISLAIFSPNVFIRMSGTTYISTGCVFLIIAINIRVKEIELSSLAVKVLAMKTSFVRYVSHEIRSPLQVISTLLGMVENRIADVHRSNVNALLAKGNSEIFIKLHEKFQLVVTVVKDSQSACKIACDVLNGLLGIDKTTLTGCAFSSVLEESLELYIRLAKVKAQDIHVTSSIPREIEIYLNTDAKEVKQVIGNVVSNALKFSPLGSAIEVVVSPVHRIGSPLQSAGSTPISRGKMYEGVRVLVRDQGCGISVGNQKKLFKSIIQFKPNQMQNGEGSGIGLFMSYSIIKKQGGDMGVVSLGEGKGATFWIDIPVSKISTRTTTPTASGSSLDTPAPNTDNMDQHSTFRVLCVDDIESVRKVVARSLKNHGIGNNIDLAVNGAHALSLIQSSLESGRPYDLVLMDFLMPVLDGPTATIQARVAGFNGIILGVTGNALEADITHFKNCGADDVLIKPLDISVLKNMLAGLRTRGTTRAIAFSSSSPTSPSSTPLQFRGKVEYAAAAINKFPSRVDIPMILASAVAFGFLILQLIPAIFAHTPAFDVGVTSFPVSYDMQLIFGARISSITMAVYMTCCAVLDHIYGLNRGGETMLVITIGGLLIWDIYLFTYTSLSTGVALFYAVQMMRSYLSLFGPMLYLYQNCKQIWTGNVLLLVNFLDGVGFTLRLHRTLKMYDANVSFMLMTGFHVLSAFLRTSRLYMLNRKLRKQAIWFSLDYSCYTIAWILAASDMLIFFSVPFLYKSSAEEYTNDNVSIFLVCSHVITICILFAASRFAVFERLSNDNTIQNKRALISHVSHEIRSPLNIILLGIDYLCNDVMKDLRAVLASLIAKDASHDVSKSLISTEADSITPMLTSFDREISQDFVDIFEVRNACCDAIAIINDLLAYEKLERRCFALERKVESFVPIVAAVVNELKSTAMVSGVRLEGTYVDSAYVNLDSAKIAYATRNLLQYAIKIFPESCHSTVEVSLQRLGSQDERSSGSGCIRTLFRLLFSLQRDKYVFPDSNGNQRQGSIEPSHVRVKVTHDLSEGKELRHENILLSAFARGPENSANTVPITEGVPEQTLGLYVCHGIVEAHEGKLHINYNHDKTKVEFIIDLPLVSSAAKKLSKAAIAESAARYGSASDALKRARSDQRHQLGYQIPDRVHVDSWASEDANQIELAQSMSDALYPSVPAVDSPVIETSFPSPHVEVRLQVSANLHVLCVDDDAANLRLLVRVLTASAICDSTDSASNGQEALQLILKSMSDTTSAKPYDIVFMDGRMPVMDGPTATRQARAAGFRGLIIGVTGGAFDDEINAFKQSGVDEVLLKPFVQSDLLRIIRAALA